MIGQQSREEDIDSNTNTGGSPGRLRSVLRNLENTGSPGRQSSMLENREKTVTQILGLDQRTPPPTSSRPYFSTSSMLPPAEGGGQDHNIGNAQGIAKMATSLGIMSAKEADVAIRRHVSASQLFFSTGAQNLKIVDYRADIGVKPSTLHRGYYRS